MKSSLAIVGVSFFLYVVLIANTVLGYGYKRDEDPLIKVFKAVVYHGKGGNWNQITKEIASISDRIRDVQAIFGVDLAPKINGAIVSHDLHDLIKYMANLIFLAIGEKFYWNRSEKLEIYIKAKVRLRLTEEYYVTLLAGNVREYDMKHRTNFNEVIYQMFIDARATLGSLGFFGAGAIKPDVERFIGITDGIEKKLMEVFPYFER